MSFVSALDPAAAPRLRQLELQMHRYYNNPAYHEEWIRCGDTGAAMGLLQRIPKLQYHGVDIIIPATRSPGLQLARAGGTAVPFPDAEFDVVISMFTIEHTIRPDHFLDEAWRVLRSNGRLIIIAPDFFNNAVASAAAAARLLAAGEYTFPIWTAPRCLELPGFLTDCDAVFPSCPEEITNYLHRSTHRPSTPSFSATPAPSASSS